VGANVALVRCSRYPTRWFRKTLGVHCKPVIDVTGLEAMLAMLRNELEGYSEYAKRTRYRLFPHLR
jgi:hypothetical protein